MDNQAIVRLKSQAQTIEGTSQFARDLLVLFEQLESLQRDKEALIEVLEKYAGYENLIKARLTPANDILSRMKG